MPAKNPTKDKAKERDDAPVRVGVRKTYKLFIGGAFPRSESGRSYVVTGADGTFLANAALASRKDARDAVRAARAAASGWAGATAYNRGQILYRIAEMLEGRRSQFVAEVSAGEGVKTGKAESIVDTAIDRWVWYAGWSDKVAQVYGNANPVAGPYFNLTTPEPTGVVGHRGAPGLLPARPGQRDRAGHRHRERVRCPGQRPPTAAGDHAGRGAGHLRPAGRGGQPAHRARGRGRAVAGRAHGCQRAST